MSHVESESSSWERSRVELADLWHVPIQNVSDEDIFAYRYPKYDEPRGRLHRPLGRSAIDGLYNSEPSFEGAVAINEQD